MYQLITCIGGEYGPVNNLHGNPVFLKMQDAVDFLSGYLIQDQVSWEFGHVDDKKDVSNFLLSDLSSGWVYSFDGDYMNAEPAISRLHSIELSGGIDVFNLIQIDDEFSGGNPSARMSFRKN